MDPDGLTWLRVVLASLTVVMAPWQCDLVTSHVDSCKCNYCDTPLTGWLGYESCLVPPRYFFFLLMAVSSFLRAHWACLYDVDIYALYKTSSSSSSSSSCWQLILLWHTPDWVTWFRDVCLALQARTVSWWQSYNGPLIVTGLRIVCVSPSVLR